MALHKEANVFGQLLIPRSFTDYFLQCNSLLRKVLSSTLVLLCKTGVLNFINADSCEYSKPNSSQCRV